MHQPWYIVGGGIIGLLAARELAQTGESVVILDRQAVGQESSWAGGGILSPLYPWRYPEPVTRLALIGQAVYPELAKELKVRTGIDPEWTRSGMLVFAANDEEIAAAWAKNHSITLNQVDSTQASSIEPHLSPNLGSGLWLPTVAQIRNPRLLAAISRDLRQSGVEFRENVIITGFSASSSSLSAIQTSAGEIATNRCLVAGGAWSAQLLATTGLDLPIRPVRGQMLLLNGKRALVNTMILKDNYYIIPRRDGHILIGSTLEEVGFDKSMTPIARAELLAAASSIIPDLARCSIERQWAGLRPGSPDGVPFIGQHPGISGLYVCSGHYRNGIVLAPGSARLVADLMLNRRPALDLGQFSLVRQ